MQNLQDLIAEKGVKLTASQAKLVKNLLNGCKIMTKNAHRMSGGETVLVDKSGYDVDYRVYKTAQNLGWKLGINIFSEYKF